MARIATISLLSPFFFTIAILALFPFAFRAKITFRPLRLCHHRRRACAPCNVACHFGIKYAAVRTRFEGSRQSSMRSPTIGDSAAHGNSLRLIWYSAAAVVLRGTALFSTCAHRVDKLLPDYALPLPRAMHELHVPLALSVSLLSCSFFYSFSLFCFTNTQRDISPAAVKRARRRSLHSTIGTFRFVL